MELYAFRKYKTFSGDDIWNALNAAAVADDKIPKESNIKTIANTWIDKDRLPVVIAQRNYDSKTVSLKQVRISNIN
jgi:aminopeptidase N